MNYRHAFHAGNFADVLKHMVLVACLDHLLLKDSPVRYTDVFAGAGAYDLTGEEAGRSPEWQAGIGQVAAVSAASDTGKTPALVTRWLAAMTQAGWLPGQYYPGSPLIASRLLRGGDSLRLCELNPREADELAARMGPRRGLKIEVRDGWGGVRGLLPPVERRGLTLVDPPFEKPGEFARLVTALEDCLRLFAGGTAILWHADKDPDATAAYRRKLAASGARLLAADLAVAGYGAVRGLTAAGVTILNPPFTLEPALREALPWLASTLARAPGGGWRLERLSGSW